MATVYKAHQIALDRLVALKVLPAFFAEEPGFRERFQREAITVAQLRHPNILTIFDYGEENGVAFIVTEYVDGGTLSGRLGEPVAVDEVCDLLGPVASALDYAHERGVIHRDVKPSNILIAADGAPILADFGLAQMMGSLPRLTQTGTLAGTPEYMAPEYAGGEPAGPATDQYSLAIVAYEMLTGRVPFSADTPLAVLLAQTDRPLPPPRSINPALNERVETVLMRALAKRPLDRYPSVSEFISELRAAAHTIVEIARDPDPKERGPGRRNWLIGTAIVAALAVVAVLFITRGGTTVATATSPTVAVSPSVPTAQLVLADSMADPTAAAFARSNSGNATDPIAYQWDYAYANNVLGAHVVASGTETTGTWLVATAPLARTQAIPRHFAVEVHARATRGPVVSAFGIGIQGGPNIQYGFDITPGDRSYRFVSANDRTPVDAGQSNYVLNGTESNLLRVEITGTNVRVLVNGHELVRTTRAELTNRQNTTISLRWAMIGPPAGGNSIEVQFTQFALYALP
jgi:hypothetical protein